MSGTKLSPQEIPGVMRAADVLFEFAVKAQAEAATLRAAMDGLMRDGDQHGAMLVAEKMNACVLEAAACRIAANRLRQVVLASASAAGLAVMPVDDAPVRSN